MRRVTNNPNARLDPYLVPFNKAERDVIRQRAGQARLKPIVFIRTMALEGQITAIPAINDHDRVELRRQGNNLNQLAHALNSGVTSDVKSLLTEIRSLMKKIDLSLSGK